jgi:hypothetical protein
MQFHVFLHGWLLASKDNEKTIFIMPWRIFYYKVMSFGLKNAEGHDDFIS